MIPIAKGKAIGIKGSAAGDELLRYLTDGDRGVAVHVDDDDDDVEYETSSSTANFMRALRSMMLSLLLLLPLSSLSPRQDT